LNSERSEEFQTFGQAFLHRKKDWARITSFIFLMIASIILKQTKQLLFSFSKITILGL